MAENKSREQIDLNSADLDTISKLPMVGEKGHILSLIIVLTNHGMI